MFKSLYVLIRNSISKTKLFWKYRHLFQPQVWRSYKSDQDNLRRLFYSNFLKTNNLNSIFEFGCASGPNFFSIKKELEDIYFFGYDISIQAIKTVNYNSSNIKYNFTHKLSPKSLEEFIKKNNIDNFDLAIFDRVLYMIDQKTTRLIFNIYSKYFKYIIIDDFHSDNPCWDKEKYIFSKNYIDILDDYHFQIIDIDDSQLPSSTAKKYAKRLIFVNQKL